MTDDVRIGQWGNQQQQQKNPQDVSKKDRPNKDTMTIRGTRPRRPAPRFLGFGLGPGRNWPGPLSPAELIGTQLVYRRYYRPEIPNEI